MSYGVQTDNTLVQPLEGAIVRRRIAAADLTSGEAVYLDSNGYAALTDSADVAKNFCYGIVVHDAAAGKPADIVTLGPITMATGATPGALVYTNGTGGSVGATAESAGAKVCVVGVAESATVVYVRPYMTSFS